MAERLSRLPLVAMAVAAMAMAAAAQDWSCRMVPVDADSAHAGCGLPFSLSNFQGYFPCDPRVKVARPRTLEELQAVVASHPKVRANGVGASWWPAQFCAGTDSSSVNVVMTELASTLELIKAPVDPVIWLNRAIPDSFPIKVDEDARTVTVAAGIPQRLLLDYLSEYRHWKEPAGGRLHSFTWYTEQTIGGAVATATHGSTMKHGSLSSQVVRLTVLLANGTFLAVTPATNPHLFRALATSVGRLGVVTELVMRIRPQMAVTKSLQEINFKQLAQQIKGSQDKYVAARKAGSVDDMKRALFEVDETQSLWIVESNAVWRTDFTHSEKEPLSVLLNVGAGGQEPSVAAFSGPEEGVVFEQKRKRPVAANRRMSGNVAYWGRFYATLGREYVLPGTFESRKCYLSMTEQGTRLTSTFAPYIQMEVAVPFEVAGDCLLELNREIYGSRRLWEGFRNPALIRFNNGEEMYLSPNHQGPHLWVNMEDWVSLSSGVPNDKFLAVIRMFRWERGPAVLLPVGQEMGAWERCQARLHWGKAGWDELSQCFDGAKEYPSTWCHFGCAAQELDPTGKFAGAGQGAKDVWKWGATRGGRPVPFASCCTPQGFSPDCSCASRGSCSS
ncbi:hypothetical protein CHLNCDRAFT_143085 [Chlorella variabilis]|uniref:FAD-binding PCMH-type domain-containing protein n=1 Tax=Chlorella variabilis TaxID=554065 RepID=E1Z9F1_CHLVA|nr:hypothetical protein CHLNCDRAFT_143085 [Chlorella variabilis]EFN57507.1 hypothetical protein CHLNCDRAFT_143085 [Chlorella variabilis]|eukprot:XP_005849609.1 hypothetical protein CHLNCDRAFT_143085 [Chlorella variabilis]